MDLVDDMDPLSQRERAHPPLLAGGARGAVRNAAGESCVRRYRRLLRFSA
jgi:hypothetical protein